MAERKPKTPAATPAEASAEAPQGVEPNAIEVTAKCERFRRAGREFTRDVTTIRLSELAEDEFNLLYHEPMLAVQLTFLEEA